MSAPELKPCPHCGEAEELYRSYHGLGGGEPYAIDCLGCGCDFTPREGMDVIAAWNSRAPDPAKDALIDRLKIEAQGHAMEAQTANATIGEIYQAVTGKTGEPGNWNGAQPVIAALATKDATIAELREALEPFALVAEHDIGDDEADSDRFTPILGELNRAPKITVGHMRAASAALSPIPDPAGGMPVEVDTLDAKDRINSSIIANGGEA